MSMAIGKVAGKGGANLQTIRYYEREGLLPEAPRMSSGYRLFTDDAVRRVLFIKRAGARLHARGDQRAPVASHRR